MAITPMTMPPDGLAFLLGKHAEDLGPLKQYREGVVNAFEACNEYRVQNPLDRQYQPQVHVGIDPFYFESTGIRKLVIADNGIGMTPKDVRSYINGFVVSGKVQAFDANFGVGAKIAMAAQNPFGVEYRIWHDGEGYIARLVRDEETGGYGLYQFEVGDDLTTDVAPIARIDKAQQALLRPDFIKEHGVAVVLLGANANSDTAVAPDTEEISHKDYWFANIMNRQFYTVPAGIKFSAKLESIDTDHPQYRVIRGHKWVNDRFAKSSGTVDIGDAFAHWWLLDETRKDDVKKLRMWYSSFSGTKHHGHVAVLHKNELFDFTDKYDAIPILQKFGIVVGHENVVVYVEPKPTARVNMSLTRKSLIFPGGLGIPWKQYANAFYDNMPQELRDYVSARLAVADKSVEEYVNEQMRKLKKYLFVQGFRPKKGGSITASRATESAEATGGTGASRHSGTASSEKKQQRKDFAWVFDPNGVAGEGVLIDTTPKIDFLSEEEGGFRGRAARYDDDRNRITINLDFAVYLEHIDYGLETVAPEHRDNAIPVVEKIVKGVYATHLVSAVMTAKSSFRNKAQWAGDGFDSLVSAEALTTTALARSYVASDVKRQVANSPALRPYIAKKDGGTEEAA